MSYPTPTASGWNPWPTAPSPPRWSPLIGVLIVLVAATVAVVAFGVTLILTRDQPVASTPPTASSAPPPSTAAPPTRTPTPSPTATPTPRPPRPPPTKPRDILVRNPLYDQRIAPTGCGQPPRPLPTGRRGDERYLNAMMRCLSRAYAVPMQAAGYWIAFHEYAHHVQRRIDVLAASCTRNEDQLQISRRIELQADCLMAMGGIAVRSTGLGPDDRAELRAWRTAVPDEIHGRSASQLHWIDRGWRSSDFGRCSTWTATKHIR